ncbi:hypothetical protein [Arthrobacter sp. KK5.5]|uniref:hypothetical protein n=1 Tax=Arthrobacter sp. KK5.5 TaxID=3373084 RepID=UPI003EE68DED
MEEPDASLDRSNHPPNPQTEPVDTQPRGLLLFGVGLAVALLFGIYLWIRASDEGGTLASPIWIGVAFGLIMAGFGLYRRLTGPSKLDFAKGGTNVSE